MIYEYSCSVHGIFEVQQKLADPPLKYCPECEKNNLYKEVSRIISTPALKFSGTGFYKTDYPKTDSKKQDND